jgi:hypothetical protein
MCVTETGLATLTAKELIHHYRRAIELNSNSSGNGQSPFDIDQLEAELERRMSLEQEW